ncbi:uncharacterized protein LOC119105553 [Pollicipes pollicipes]|uniref:uncharacterized protein LOC119105553 n=1 Tax=Pollicipes pollicipes TaxID=41117 RepID=UPI001884B7B1|nr:uncharacterized protein LOC119105553 [Pollicipes pollicipes]
MAALREGEVLRRLGPQETGWHTLFCKSDGASLLQYSLVVDSQQRLSSEQVQQALEALQRQIPMLRTRVEERDDGPYLVAGACPSVQLTVLPPGGDWLDQHHCLLQQTKIDPRTGPLWRACLLHDPANIAPPVASSHRAVLYLSLCHTITDGLSNAKLCGKLLENLDCLLRGLGIADGEPAPVYPSVEELLQSQVSVWSWSFVWNMAWDLLSRLIEPTKSQLLDKFVKPFDPSQPAGTYSTATVAVTVPAPEVARLRALCRAHGVSLNAALSAAVSFAGARLSGVGGDQSAHLPTVWLVNARRYLPSTDWMFLSTVAGVRLDVRVEHADVAEFWSVAEPERGGLGGAELSGCLYSVNNLGSLERVLPRTTAVRAVELHRSVRAPPALADTFGSHCFQTVAGQLCYDLNYVRGRVAEADAAHFSRLVVEVLAEVAAPSDTETDAE